MSIGMDFDNTIVKYDRVFAAAARSRGWVPQAFSGTKKQLRDAVRLLPDGEIKWQILQGEVYGTRMGEAELFPGVAEFIAAARQRCIPTYIVSHKTRYSNFDPKKIDLREAALMWLEKNGFFDPNRLGFVRDEVFFADTRAEKIARISALDCRVFIDDLEEVLIDPGFPMGVKRVLFIADETALGDQELIVHKTWPAIARCVLDNVDDTKAANDQAITIGGRLAGARVRSMRPARKGGGNNRLFRIETVDGRSFALKSYPRQASDPRNRLMTEFGALEFLRRHDIGEVPVPIAKDETAGFALYEWIEGHPVQPSAATVDATAPFIAALNRLNASPDAATLPLASEACLSAQAIVEQVEARLRALEEQAPDHPALRLFLDETFRPALKFAVANARQIYEKAGLTFEMPIGLQQRTLSPSDFGFHNALLAGDRIVFLDFEYFGWDDPVKLSCDFVLHPGMDLTDDLKSRFLRLMFDIFRADRTFAARLRATFQLYAMRWVMILLNEFLPERWARRLMAGAGGDRDAILQVQLNKAHVMAARATNESVMA